MATILRSPHLQASKHPARAGYLNLDTSQSVPLTLRPVGVIDPARRGNPTPVPIDYRQLFNETSYGMSEALRATTVVTNPPIRTGHLNQPIIRPIQWLNLDTSRGMPKVLFLDASFAPACLEMQRVLERPSQPVDTSMSMPETLRSVTPVASPIFSKPVLQVPRLLWLNNTTSENNTIRITFGSSITGTSNTTNANDFVSTGTGTTTVLGTSSTTNNNDTLSSSGTTTIVGTLAKTNANDTSNASGSVGSNITGTANVTNANDTSAATGSSVLTGSAAISNQNDTSTTSGTTTIVGTLAKTNNNDAISAGGFVGNAPPATTKLPMTGAGS